MNKAKLKGQLEKQAEDLLKGLNLTISSSLIKDTLKHFYDLGLAQMETQFNMDFTRVQSSLSDSYDIVAEEIKGLNQATRQKLKLQLMVGLSGQESGAEISARIRKVFDVSTSRARAITVTETNRVFNQAHYDGAVQSGLKLKKYAKVQMDAKTSPICIYMNSKYGTPEKSINMDDLFIYPKTGKTFQLSPFHINCYHKDTEVMTQRGFVKFSELIDDDVCLSLNPTTKQLEYANIVNFIKKKVDKIRVLKNKQNSFNLAVSLNHPFFTYQRKRVGSEKRIYAPKTCKFEDLNSENRFYKSSEWIGKQTNTININGKDFNLVYFMKFLGYYLSEGNIDKNTTNRIKISQSTYKDIMADDLIKLVSDYTTMEVKVYADSIYLYSKELFDYVKDLGYSWEKYIPAEIKEYDSIYLKVLYDSFVLGEGHITKGKWWKGYQFKDKSLSFTSSKRLASDMVELLIKTGKSASMSYIDNLGKEIEFKNGKYKIKHPVYRITELNSTYSYFNRITSTIKTYDDFVYDVELNKNHTLLIKYKDSIHWNSNCRTRVLYTQIDNIKEDKDD